MTGIIVAFADMFGLLAGAIAADWEHHRDKRVPASLDTKTGPRVYTRPWTRHHVLLTMIDLAEPSLRGIDIDGFIHPELMGDKRLLGFWTM